MCSIGEDHLEAISRAIRCWIVCFGLAGTTVVIAADFDVAAMDDLAQPLCRRDRDLQLAQGWDLEPDAHSVAQTLTKLELPSAHLSHNEFDGSRNLVWPGTDEFPFTDDLNEWHRLRVYGSRNAVRVVTLWDSRHATLALQTDRRGDPMLRWTSKELSRGEASRGLLDSWLSPRDAE